MKKANGIKILSALLVAMTTLCGCAGGTNDSSSSSSATMSSEKSSSNDTSSSSSATTSSEESSSMDNSSSGDPYLEALNITYTLDEENHTYTVTGVKDKQAEEIDLPRELTIDNVIYVLVRIGDSAFSSCSSLTNITIPSSVTSIGNSAFWGCNSLTIYCEASSKPNGWDNNWNPYGRPVYWGINQNNFIENDGIQYVIIDEKAVITKYVGTSTNVKIPATIEINENTYDVTSIEERAFYKCSFLTSITIPNSVTSIGVCAFEYCYFLESLTLPFIDQGLSYYFSTIPKSLKTITILGGTSIPEYAFSYCDSLEGITIPSSVTSIGDWAFSRCSSLTSVTIPDSVTGIGESAFEGCNSLIIHCEASEKPSGWNDNWNSSDRPVYWGINENTFIEKDGILYVVIDEKAVVTRYVGTSTNVVIPATIEINENTYDVTSIGRSAFSGCNSLESLTLPFIDTYLGYYFGATKYLDNSTYVPESLKTITILGGINIPEYAFSHCESLESITITNSVTSIGRSAFSWCYSLTSITIPSSVTSIGEDAFLGCNSLIIHCEASSESSGWSYDWNSSRPVYWGVNENNFIEKDGIQYVIVDEKAVITKYVGTSTNVEIPTTIEIKGNTYDVTSIGRSAFSWCYSLTSITIPSSVTSIGEAAFYRCSSLTSVVIPNSVTSIGERAFYQCSSLESIVIPNSVTSIGNYAFSYCSSLKSITIPNSVTSIGNAAFYNCTQLQHVTFEPNNKLESIGISAFSGCNSLESLILPCINTYLGYYFGATKYLDNSTYVPESLKTITILGGINIPKYAFYRCSSLTNITIPNSVTSIGEMAFYNCSSLESLTLPFIDTYLGYYFGATKYLDNSTYVPESLKTITILGGINIPKYAFSGCSSLTSITIPSSVTSIGKNAFWGCNSLTIYCEASSKPSGWDSDWNYNRPVYWEINENNFIEKDDIQYVVIDEKAVVTRYVGTSTNVVIPTTIEIKGNTYDVTSIGNYAFSYCSSLKSITIPNSVTSIGERAFYQCSSLESIVIPNSVTSIGNYAFSYCSSLTSIKIPSSVTTVGGRVFQYCYSLTIYCEASSKPSGWDSDWNYNRPVYWGINENNFIEKDGLQYVIIDKKAVVTRYVGTSTNVEIPATIEIKGNTYDVTSIGESAFYNCSSLTTITIPNSVTSIGEVAFEYCRSLTTITIPSCVTSIGEFAFHGCDSLTIYCEVLSEPNEWNDNWNSIDRPVYWGEEWHYENGVPTLN